MRQQQGKIGQWLADRNYWIHDAGDSAFVLRRGNRDADDAPAEVHEHFVRWCELQDLRTRGIRGARPEEISLLDKRLVSKGYARFDEEQLAALREGGEQAEALLDDLQARVGIFTDDVSAAMAGDDPHMAFDPSPERDGFDREYVGPSLTRDQLLAKVDTASPEDASRLKEVESYMRHGPMSFDRAVQMQGLPASAARHLGGYMVRSEQGNEDLQPEQENEREGPACRF
jgi:hypothetical protein